MRRIITAWIYPAAAATLGTMLALCLLMSGCGKAPTAADNAGARMTGATKTSTPPPQETAVAMAGQPNRFLSVFSTNDSRDPFNPKMRSKTPAATPLTGSEREGEQAQLIAALQAGFQGIYGSADEREVMVHGVLLREKVQQPVSIMVSGQRRALKIRAMRIYRNAAELQVEGLPQTIVVPRPR